MRLISRVTVIGILLAPSIAAAQILTSGNVFLGFSYAKGELGLLNTHSMYGWNGSLEGKMMKYFGVVADFGAHYGGYTQAPVGGPVGRGSRQRQLVYGDVWPKGVIADRQVHAVRARAVGSGP